MSKIPVEFRTKDFKDNLLLNSFSQFDGVIVPNLPSLKFNRNLSHYKRTPPRKVNPGLLAAAEPFAVRLK